MLDTTENESLVHRARNLAVARFYQKTEATHFLFIDADIHFDPDSKRYLSEDYAFCRRWQKMGGKIYADVMTTLGHVGNIRFHGKLEERLKASASV